MPLPNRRWFVIFDNDLKNPDQKMLKSGASMIPLLGLEGSLPLEDYALAVWRAMSESLLEKRALAVQPNALETRERVAAALQTTMMQLGQILPEATANLLALVAITEVERQGHA